MLKKQIVLFFLLSFQFFRVNAQSFFDEEGNAILKVDYKVYKSPILKRNLAYNIKKNSFCFYPSQNKESKKTIVLLPGSFGFNSIDLNYEQKYATALSNKGYNVFVNYYITDSSQGSPVEEFIKMVMKPSYSQITKFNKNIENNVLALKNFIHLLQEKPEKLGLIQGQITGVISFRSACTMALDCVLQDTLSSKISYLTTINPTYVWVRDSISNSKLPPLLAMSSTDEKITLGPEQYFNLYRKWNKSASFINLYLYANSAELGLYDDDVQESGWFISLFKWLEFNKL